MIRNYKVVTITHQNVDVSEISNFVLKISDDEMKKAQLEHIKETLEIDELVYLNTCNRVTFVFYYQYSVDFEFIENLFRLINPDITSEHIENLENYVSVYEGNEAVNHIFEVSSSIDSLVVGEREIYRQMRDAFKWAKENTLASDYLKLFEKHLINTAKKVYNNTRIGEKPLSVVFLGYEFMLSEEIDSSAKILLIGAGETNYLVSKFLNKGGFQNVKIFNRTLSKAKKIASLHEWEAFELKDLSNHINDFDVIITATSFPEFIVKKQDLNKSKKKRVFIDFSVPANIDKSIQELDNCTIIDIDTLRLLADRNLNFRKKEIVLAKQIITKHVVDFQADFIGRKIEKSLTGIANEIKAVKQKAMNEVFSKELEGIDKNTYSLINKMMEYMEKKCISIPMKASKAAVLKD